jgi:hypothetical protein
LLARVHPGERNSLESRTDPLPAPGSVAAPLPEQLSLHNWRARVWAPLLKKVNVTGTFHMLRHFFVMALIQSGVNAKVAQTLAGHHFASFTLDQYADAVPQQLEEAGEKVSTLLLEASGSILVAEAKQAEVKTAQVIELERAPGEIRTPDPQVRSLMLYPTELRARGADSTTGIPLTLGAAAESRWLETSASGSAEPYA